MKRCPHCSTIMYLREDFCYKCSKEIQEKTLQTTKKESRFDAFIL